MLSQVKENADVFIVSKNMGSFIKDATPKHNKIHICTNYNEAYSDYLLHINPHNKHLVILDSRESGELLDLATTLKDEYKNAKIIFMVSSQHKNTAIDAVQSGIVNIFLKPFFPDHLTELIEKLMNE